MKEIEKTIDEIVDYMNEENISKEDQINILKKYTKFIYDSKESIENNFIIGTFMSSFGLGFMLNTIDINNVYISSLLIISGLIISISGNKNSKIYKK